MKIPQYDLGIWFGGTKTQIMRVQMYSGSFAVLFSMVAAWPPLLTRFPWLEFWMLPIGVVVAVALIGLFDFIFMVRSEYSFQAHQVWNANNPTVDYLKAIVQNQEAIMKKLDIPFTPVTAPLPPFKFKPVSDSIPIMPVMDEEDRLVKKAKT